jgi:hypothetical protein
VKFNTYIDPATLYVVVWLLLLTTSTVASVLAHG